MRGYCSSPSTSDNTHGSLFPDGFSKLLTSLVLFTDNRPRMVAFTVSTAVICNMYKK